MGWYRFTVYAKPGIPRKIEGPFKSEHAALGPTAGARFYCMDIQAKWFWIKPKGAIPIRKWVIEE